jgi:hypothetical protein
MLLAAGMLVTVESEALAATSGNCRTEVSKFKASDDDKVVTTESESFVAVGGTEIDIVQGVVGCIVVSFTAEARSEIPGVLADVAIYVDGKRCRTGTFGTSAFDFVTTTLTAACKVAAGTRTVQVRFRRGGGDGCVRLRNYTTIVNYQP